MVTFAMREISHRHAPTRGICVLRIICFSSKFWLSVVRFIHSEIAHTHTIEVERSFNEYIVFFFCVACVLPQNTRTN